MVEQRVPSSTTRTALLSTTRPVREPLENYANNWTPPGSEPGSRRARRYGRRSALWHESSLPRVRKCGRVARVPDGLVGVRSGPNGAGFSGLCTCGSVWACPVCNAKVMSRRALEIGLAIAAHQAQGGAVIFQTLTMRHHRGQALAGLWDALQGGWASLRAGKVWKRRSGVLGLRGYIRAVEVTDGPNGWHVHIHALLLVDGAVTRDQVDDFAGWAHGKWSRALVRQGLDAPLPVGQLARLVTGPADADLSAYLSKSTDLGLELTQSQSKRARSAHGTSPVWEQLTAAIEQGDADALDRWHEWEKGSHGRRQITWSQGLRDDLGLGQEQTDEEIAGQEAGDVDLVLITAEGWASLVARHALIPQVLDAADVGPEHLRSWLTEHGVEYIDPSMRGAA